MKFSAKFFDELTNKEVYELLKSRAEVFVVEQSIKYVDMDNTDYDSLHCIFFEDERVVAYLRAFYKDKTQGTVKVGRVLTLTHGKGIGRLLMDESIRAIKERMDCKKICIDSQTHAKGFYEKFGFEATSDEFLEEGIPHISMELVL